MREPMAELGEMSEAAEMLQTRPGAGRRRERYDRPRFTYRIDPATAEGLREVQGWYRRAGYQVSLDQIADDLLLFALEEWQAGRVRIGVREMEAELQAVARE